MFEGLATLFPIAIAIQNNPAVIFFTLVGDDGREILHRIEGFAPSANNRTASAIAADFQQNAVFLYLWGCGNSNAQLFINGCYIVLYPLYSCLLFRCQAIQRQRFC